LKLLQANKILVTGANGFVGHALCVEAIARGMKVRGSTRRPCTLPIGVESAIVGEVGERTDWQNALSGCDVIVHLAAHVHIMNEHSAKSLRAFQDVNLHATMNLAKQAAAAGIKRFVFLSSIGVNGAFTAQNNKFTEDSLSKPHNPYTTSKLEAELALIELAKQTSLDVVILRSPLVYGACAPGNFAQLMKFVSLGIPLPLASVCNQRDFIYLGNLVDAIIICTGHLAARDVYLVSDGEAVSTPSLIRSIANSLNVRCFIFPFPVFLLEFIAGLFNKSDVVNRLTQSLQIDISKIRRELDWKPPYTLQQGLQATADEYLQSIKTKNKT